MIRLVETGAAGISTLLHSVVAVADSILAKLVMAATTLALLSGQRAKSATRLGIPPTGAGTGMMKVIFLILDMQRRPPTPTPWTQTGTLIRERPTTSHEN
jgi:hypothetical protein